MTANFYLKKIPPSPRYVPDVLYQNQKKKKKKHLHAYMNLYCIIRVRPEMKYDLVN